MTAVVVITLGAPVVATAATGTGSTTAAFTQACEHPALPGSPHVRTPATLRIDKSNVGDYPLGYGASQSVGLFTSGRSLVACVANFTHLSAQGSAGVVVSVTPRLSSHHPLTGVAGVSMSGYSTNRDDDALTVWVVGESAAAVRSLSLSVDYGEHCIGTQVCPGVIVDAGRSVATTHGRYFVATMVVTHSWPSIDLHATLSWRGPAGSPLDVENVTIPTGAHWAPSGF